MWTTLLRQIDSLHTLEATSSEWDKRLAPRCVASFPTLFPQAEGEAEWLPCRSKPACGFPHEIRKLSRNRLLAVCSEADAECASFEIQPHELAIYRFDLHHLANDLAEALTVETAVETVRPRPRLVLLGMASHAPWPVFIGLPQRPVDFVRLIETAALEPDHPARILLLPSADGLDAQTRRKAHDLGVKIGFLDKLLDYDEHAGWMAREELEDVFPDGKNASGSSSRCASPKTPIGLTS